MFLHSALHLVLYFLIFPTARQEHLEDLYEILLLLSVKPLLCWTSETKNASAPLPRAVVCFFGSTPKLAGEHVTFL